jgi:hypothetical protein
LTILPDKSAIRTWCLTGVANVDQRCAVAANLRVRKTDNAGGVSRLDETGDEEVVDKYLKISIAVLIREIAIRRKSDIAAVVGNRRLEIAVSNAVGNIARRSICDLSEPRAVVKKDFRIPVVVCTQRIVAGCLSSVLNIS